jgi:hypothetical protein
MSGQCIKYLEIFIGIFFKPRKRSYIFLKELYLFVPKENAAVSGDQSIPNWVTDVTIQANKELPTNSKKLIPTAA